MRILFIYRHVPPDTPPYAAMLCSLGAGFAAAGHQVDVWSEQPTCHPAIRRSAPRRENLGGVSILRVARLPLWHFSGIVRLLDRLVFPLRMLARAILARACGHRCDAVISATAPAVINGVFVQLAARALGARFFYHCQDIHPELGALAGLWRQRSVRHRLLLWLDTRTCAGACCLIVPSADMRATLTARNSGGARIETIGNFLPDIPSRGGSPSEVAGDRITAIFAGNTGRFQNLGAIANAARDLVQEERIAFLVMGEGKALADLKRRCLGLPNIRFLARQPLPEALEIIRGADFGIVSLAPGLTAVACPSKTLAYLALGVPVLAALDGDSVFFRRIVDAGAGAAAGPGGSGLAGTLRDLRAHPARRAEMRRRAAALYQREYSRASATRRWLSVLEAAVAQP